MLGTHLVIVEGFPKGGGREPASHSKDKYHLLAPIVHLAISKAYPPKSKTGYTMPAELCGYGYV